MARSKRPFQIGFWIGFAFCVLPGFIHCFYAERPIATVFVSIIYGVIWGLAIGGLSVLGVRIYNQLKSKDNPPGDS